MLIKSNCRLRIINGPSEKWEFSGFGTEGLVWPKLEAKITECPLWIFDIWLSICSRTKYAIIKKIEGDAIFSRSFWNFEKSITFLFIIVVEKPPNKSYRAIQYLHNEISTSILCQIEPDL